MRVEEVVSEFAIPIIGTISFRQFRERGSYSAVSESILRRTEVGR